MKAHNTHGAMDINAVDGMRMTQVTPDEMQANGESAYSDGSDLEVGVTNSRDVLPILRADRFDENATDDESDSTQLNAEDGKGMHILHACSGPDRPGAYSRYLAARGASCRDFDIVRDPSDDLTCQVAWMKFGR